MVCMVHCLMAPILLAVVPSSAALGLGQEAFHIWMLVAVLPLSTVALFLGCRKHQVYRHMKLGCVGLVFLISGVLLSSVIGELGEKGFTVIGGCLLAFAHFKNYRLCLEGSCSNCGENHSQPE